LRRRHAWREPLAGKGCASRSFSPASTNPSPLHTRRSLHRTPLTDPTPHAGQACKHPRSSRRAAGYLPQGAILERAGSEYYAERDGSIGASRRRPSKRSGTFALIRLSSRRGRESWALPLQQSHPRSSLPARLEDTPNPTTHRGSTRGGIAPCAQAGLHPGSPQPRNLGFHCSGSREPDRRPASTRRLSRCRQRLNL
jgi:hypothetical protein